MSIANEYKLQADNGDPWGSAMSALFDIAEELDRRGDEVPAEWEYRPGALGPGAPDTYFAQAVLPLYDASDMRAFGSVLARYTDNLRAAGMSY